MTFGGTATYAYSSDDMLRSTSGGISLSYDPAMRLYQVSGGTPGTQRWPMTGRT
jgi:hypothetical protein